MGKSVLLPASEQAPQSAPAKVFLSLQDAVQPLRFRSILFDLPEPLHEHRLHLLKDFR